MATDYGSGWYSNHGRLTYKGRDVSSLSGEELDAGIGHLSSWRDSRGLTTKNSRAEVEKLKAAKSELPFELDMSGVEEALAQMAEYQKLALEASMREETPLEPLKRAAEVQDETRADTNRLQLLRRGLMSTFTRYGGWLGGNGQRLGV